MAQNPSFAKLIEVVRRDDPETKYEVLVEIGQGSFGSVYKARDRETGAIVAIKKMTCSPEQSSDELDDIRKEIEFMASLDHENIIKHCGSFLKGNTVWVVMEFCMGSVADILEVFKAPLQEAEIAAVLAKVVEGLIFLHSKKRIHRDIKAANILMTSRGKVKIADFGSGSMSDPANTFVGTPCWMAPEVILAMESGLYSCKADIWSLGITAIELAERKPPLIEMNTMSALYHIPEKPPPTLKKPAAWSNEFSDFIESCLRKDPEQRLTAAELLQHPFLQNDKANHNRTLKLLVRRSKNAASLEPGEPIVFEAPVAVAAPAAVAAPTPLASTVSLDEDGTEDTEELRKRRRNQSKPAKKDKAADGDAAAPAATPTASPARSAMPSHLAAPLKRDSFANLAPSDANHTPRRGAHERMASVVSVESNIVSDFHLNDSANDAWEAENHDQTIRPVRRATEMAENDNNAKAQLKELKGLQMAQQKQTKQLLKTQEANLAEYRRQIEKDLEAESKQHSNEIDKLLARLRSEMEAFQKSQATEWKSFRKEQQSRAKTEVKENARVIKAAVKEKEKAFKEALSRVTDKAEKKALKESQEKELAAFVQQSQDEFAAQQQFRQEEEARKRAIAMSHDLHAVEIRHSDSETERRRMAREVNAKHRQSNLDLEGRKLLEQLRERHELMQTQQGKKLLTEAESMQQQQKKREKDLGKQLAQEAKNLPKHVKSVKAKMVRDKQETIRMTKQKFESLQKRIDEDEVSKEERRRLKEEQRLEMLRDVTRTEAEFDKKISETVEIETTEFDHAQRELLDALAARHEKERSELEAYQVARRRNLVAQHEREMALLVASNKKAWEELDKTIKVDTDAFNATAQQNRQAMLARHKEEDERLLHKKFTLEK